VLWSKCIIFWIIFAIAWSSLADGDLPRIRVQPTSVVSQQLPLGKSLEFCVYATNKRLEEATGLGFEPRLTDPGAVVLPLRQPILYEKVFSSLMALYRSFYPNRQAQLQGSTSPETKPRRNDFGDTFGDSQDAQEHALSRKETQRGS
jgi:hypothetical protein